jgi:hypothetical protein
VLILRGVEHSEHQRILYVVTVNVHDAFISVHSPRRGLPERQVVGDPIDISVRAPQHVEQRWQLRGQVARSRPPGGIDVASPR